MEEHDTSSSDPLKQSLPPETLDPSDVIRLRQEAENVDNTIRALQTQLLQLEARRSAIQDRLSAVIYPVNTLPAEVLCHTFQALVASSIPIEVNSALLSITAVCQRWRSVAIADPHLWTTLCYILRAPIRDYRDPLFYCFLERTQGLPIVVHIDERGTSQCSLPSVLFDSSHQWTEAYLTDADAESDGTTFRTFRLGSLDTVLNLPYLTTLTLNVDMSAGHDHSRTFGNAPHLRELTISHLPLVSLLGFPVHQLRKLTLLRSTSSGDTLYLLPRLVALEELTLDSLFHNQRGDQQPIELPLLTTLSLLGDESCGITRFLILPRLTTLRLSTFDEYDGNILVPDCLRRSSANLASLSLKHAYYTDFAILLQSPIVSTALKSLTVTSLKATHREAMALATLLSRADFLPSLEKLTFVASGSPPYLLLSFLRGLHRRVAHWQSLSGSAQHATNLKLRSFRVQLPEGVSMEDMRQLHRLQQTLHSYQSARGSTVTDRLPQHFDHKYM
ncbi:hypothetical protein MIND_01328100 [Mycena indigotica]|uniref:F-box domain-containing protein n=1 Tax=Mycena indigotica TaxID=2126181 RepID=A0A8H6RZF9_9AGAR|nr:uncharacterized protein MIND_01328100 [Mycena indigotica]KAF7290149.1 hypothetical protein MIND_01328100 [Mycena indigotica]